MVYLKAFIIGGLICVIGQILIDKTKLTPARILVSFVCIGAFLSFAGIYKPFVKFAGAGATVPIIGFGHTLFSGVEKAISTEGLIGILKGGLTASSAGIASVILFSFIATIIFKSKSK